MPELKLKNLTRLTYADDPSRTDSVLKNPGKLWAVIGPFDSLNDKRQLQEALELIVRGHNYYQE